MLLPLSAAAIMATVLLWELALPRLRGSLPQLAHELAARRRARHPTDDRSRGTLASGEHPRFGQQGYDPGRELRAEQRARELLRSCVNEEEWTMYRDLGFLRVWAPTRAATPAGGAPYAYLLYPHKPIVAYVPQTGALLNEYCVAFPDETRPYGSARLPDADDVLAKWIALAADERRLIADANMHLPGRQIDPQQVREDLARLARWERERQGERPQWSQQTRPELGGQVELIAPSSATGAVIKNLKSDSNSARLLKSATGGTPLRPVPAPADRPPPAAPVRSSVRPA